MVVIQKLITVNT
ncbi:hypothetical protein FWK35_00005367 [Aphis craccivora]|nr:hypothetical protein FWK35_00034095 [Aphis craccivora]KAF0697440.1 hypothetical protein FWK35_00034321 [Aphis craccivora]KAF0711987.1 hypothetical protein FWK35_00033318 [Aphis craccivora]KAF0713666.1 hypothetical protein FWK35_00030751 [Aphis craccivora]KAF0716407.1 hypothetical protein FWK35_00030086 [Aphis craccivora]